MPRVELKDGWAVLRDPDTLTNGQRKPFMRLLATMPTRPDGTPDISRADADKIFEFGEAILTAFITEWSFGPLPAEDPDALDNLPAVVYDGLQVKAGELLGEMIPKEESPNP